MIIIQKILYLIGEKVYNQKLNIFMDRYLSIRKWQNRSQPSSRESESQQSTFRSLNGPRWWRFVTNAIPWSWRKRLIICLYAEQLTRTTTRDYSAQMDTTFTLVRTQRPSSLASFFQWNRMFTPSMCRKTR